MDELTRLYGCVTSGLCYILFWLGILVTMILIHRICQAERKKERKSQRGRESNNKLAEPSMFMMAMNQNVHLWSEMKHALLVLGLIVIYLLFMAPYIIRIKVDQIIQVILCYRAYTIESIGVASDPSLPKDPVPPVVALLVKLLGLGQISI